MYNHLPSGISWDLEYTLAEFCNQYRRTRTRRGSTHSITAPSNEKATPSTPHLMHKRVSLACSPYQVKQINHFIQFLASFCNKGHCVKLFVKECWSTIFQYFPLIHVKIGSQLIVYNETHLQVYSVDSCAPARCHDHAIIRNGLFIAHY